MSDTNGKIYIMEATAILNVLEKDMYIKIRKNKYLNKKLQYGTEQFIKNFRLRLFIKKTQLEINKLICNNKNVIDKEIISTRKTTIKQQNPKCEFCFKSLKSIGHARVNGANHIDWSMRKYHKKCWKEITTVVEMHKDFLESKYK
jgi:hypothetical protein